MKSLIGFVTILYLGSKDVWHFPCDRWLEVCKDRGVRGGGDGDSCGGGGSEGGRGGGVEVELIEGDKRKDRSVIKEKGNVINTSLY